MKLTPDLIGKTVKVWLNHSGASAQPVVEGKVIGYYDSPALIVQDANGRQSTHSSQLRIEVIEPTPDGAALRLRNEVTQLHAALETAIRAMIVTVGPSIMDGTVVRWYVDYRAWRDRGSIVTASRNGVRMDGWLDRVPDGVIDTALEAFRTLKRSRNADVSHLATHHEVKGDLIEIERPAPFTPGERFNPGTGPVPGYVVGECRHRVAESEWNAGFRFCERCTAENDYLAVHPA